MNHPSPRRIFDWVHKTRSAFMGILLSTSSTLLAVEDANPAAPAPATATSSADLTTRIAARSARKNKGDSFDPASYLAALSTEGADRGYREFPYKETPQGELRIYFKMPEGWSESDQRPVMVFFFGGGWSGGSPFACVKEAEHFAKSGVVVGLADYRVRNRQGTMPDKCAEDARSAVRWVRANAGKIGIDPARVIVGGGSAGGHIAACTANPDAPDSEADDPDISCRPDALLLYYPVASLVDGTRAFAFQRLLGEELARKLSPAQNVTAAWPPTILFSGTADIELNNCILLHDKATEAGAQLELYLAEGRGHGVARTEPRDFAWWDYATDFLTRVGIIDEPSEPIVLSGSLERYKSPKAGSTPATPDQSNPEANITPPIVPERNPQTTTIPEKTEAGAPTLAGLEPMLGKKGQLLLEELFDDESLAPGWTGKTGGLRITGGALHASMKSSDGRLGLFNREVPMQDAAIQIDFKFAGARGINISCNPSPGEISKRGHLFSVMITSRMWNITEHNDKSDRNSRSEALASASESFVPGQWYTLLLETRGAELVAQVEGKEPLRAASKDFGVKKPGIEFRVSGRDGDEVAFDNLRVWALE